MYNMDDTGTNFIVENDCLGAFRGLPESNSQAYQQLVKFYRKYPEASLATMPAIASELTIAIGFSEMLDFFRDNHSAKVHVQPGCKFFSLLGIDSNRLASKRIIRIADDDGYVYLPSASGIHMAMKRAAIQLAIKQGTGNNDIVRFFGVSNRHLRNIKH